MHASSHFILHARSGPVIAMLLILGMLISAIAVPTEDSEPDAASISTPLDPQCGSDAACSIWARFRAQHPYPYQTVAARRLGTGAVLIISEPSASVPKDQVQPFLQALFGDDLLTYQQRRWMVGKDGWLEDIIITLQDPSIAAPALLEAPALTQDRVAMLHEFLYGTVYGARIESLSEPWSVEQRLAAPALRLRPGEVNQWIRDPSLRWSALEDEAASGASFSQALSKSKYRTFKSSDDSLVLFVADRKGLLASPPNANAVSAARAAFRIFAVASDCVVAGLWTRTGQLALLGRARSQPLEVVPPLRFETFQQLLAERSDELAQSYERNHLFAGKMAAGAFADADWAPVYLSPSLRDTEMGTLLNITDQMLKSWSLAGQVDYLYFSYPLTPSVNGFAFNDRPLTSLVDGWNEDGLTFNWNTSGTTTVTEYSDLSLVVATRTGALPVTYLVGKGQGSGSSERITTLEQQGYDFFSARRDPNLARVVAYTTIYQTLIAAHSSAATGLQPVPGRVSSAPGVDALLAPTEELIAELFTEGGAAYEQVKTLFGNDHRKLARLVVDPYPSIVEYSQEQARLLRVQDDLERRADDFNARIRSAQTAGADQPSLALLLDAQRKALVADEAKLTHDARALEQIEARLIAAQELAPALNLAAPWILDLDTIRSDYEAASASAPSGWIKTASVVVSRADGSLDATGGHNIGARAVKIRVTDRVAGINLVETAEGKVLQVNPSLQASLGARAGELAREIESGRITTNAAAVAFIRNAPEARTRLAALQAEGSTRPGTWSGLSQKAAPVTDVQLRQTLLDTLSRSESDIVLMRDADGFRVAAERLAGPPPSVQCCTRFRDTVSTLKYLQRASSRQQRVMLIGEPPAHVEALASNLGTGAARPEALRELARTASGGGGGANAVDLLRLGGPGGRAPISMRILGLEKNDTSGYLALRVKRDWQRIESRVLSADAKVGSSTALQRDLLDWKPARDGEVYAVELSFGATGPMQLEARVIAGLDPSRQAAGAALVERAIDSARRAPNAQSQSLLEGAERIKQYVETHNQEQLIKRLEFMLQNRLITTHERESSGMVGAGG